MADYKEETITGVKHQRAVRVIIDNPYKAVSSITFLEEEIIELPDRMLANIVGVPLTLAFDSENPKHVEIYNSLNELYVSLREARDITLQGESNEPV